ncbi:hypothetical protein OLMES_4989 [Oleiphilus messinensis]|uniref:DUF1329 domain-containing protein n=2 Tax=Oleiphilus messinensis TaxID=141451 RepID=A0A1Y0IGM7_9GAMM|nr:hypothetical protein OLMES_4989 [Oleiphilus messinensis]
MGSWNPAEHKTLFRIGQYNWKKYEQYLCAGQIALIETYPRSFFIPVYPSVRDARLPEWYLDNTAAQKGKARIAKDGVGLVGGRLGVPFPEPETGIQVIWNHLTRFRGKSSIREGLEALVQDDGTYSLIHFKQEVLYHYDVNADDDRLLSYLSQILAPARLAGGALLLVDSTVPGEKPRLTWGYNSSDRRVRRLPNIDHDSTIPLSGGIRTADDTDMFSGSPERFEWSLLGRREMFIPYHNSRLSSANPDLDNLLIPNHINPEWTRFELHRVWHVRAKLKAGQRHIYKQRDFYLDEDSWSIVWADQYLHNGELDRISIGFLDSFEEQEPLHFPTVEVFHELSKRRYNAVGIPVSVTPVMTLAEPFPEQHFTPQALRRIGKR